MYKNILKIKTENQAIIRELLISATFVKTECTGFFCISLRLYMETLQPS